MFDWALNLVKLAIVAVVFGLGGIALGAVLLPDESRDGRERAQNDRDAADKTRSEAQEERDREQAERERAQDARDKAQDERLVREDERKTARAKREAAELSDAKKRSGTGWRGLLGSMRSMFGRS